jgi:hypothetical protein
MRWWRLLARSSTTSMPSRRRRTGSALVESALAFPVLLAALWAIVGGLQYGFWKVTAQAACGAGAEALTSGAAPVRVEWVTLQALGAPAADDPSVSVEPNGSLYIVTVSLRIPTVWGWLPLYAQQTAVPEGSSTSSRGFVP